MTRFSLRASAIVVLLLAGCSDSSGPDTAFRIDAITPDHFVAGQSVWPPIEILGRGFTGATRGWVDGKPRGVQVMDERHLRLTLWDEDVRDPGVHTIALTQGEPPDGSSPSRTFTVEPGPVITSLSPGETSAELPSVELTVTGERFLGDVAILVDYDVLATTRVSETELKATVPASTLLQPRTALVRVRRTLANGATLSNSLEWEVLTFPPTVTGVTPATVFEGDAGQFLRLEGDDLLEGARILLDGIELTTYYLDRQHVRGFVPAEQLANPRIAQVAVRNPGSGDGLSASIAFEVAPLPPAITGFSPASATAGGVDFELTVSGRGFVNGAVVTWNGSARPTEFLHAGALRADIGAGDVASAAGAEIGVDNPAGSTDPVGAVFPVLPASPAITSTSTLPFPATDLAWAPGRGRLLLTLPGSAPTHGNSLVLMDPATATVDAAIFVGSEPSAVTLSSDERYAYVALDGAPEIIRVDLDAEVADLTIPLAPTDLSPTRAEDLLSPAGLPTTVVASLRNTCCSPRHEGVAVFDGATQRPVMTPDHTGANRLVAGPASDIILGYNNETTGFGFYRLRIVADGIVTEVVRGDVFDGFGVDIETDGDRVFASSGEVASRLNMHAVGQAPVGGAVWPDIASGRVFYVVGKELVAVSSTTLSELGRAEVAPGPVAATGVVKFSSDGIAISSPDGLILAHGSLVGP